MGSEKRGVRRQESGVRRRKREVRSARRRTRHHLTAGESCLGQSVVRRGGLVKENASHGGREKEGVRSQKSEEVQVPSFGLAQDRLPQCGIGMTKGERGGRCRGLEEKAQDH